MSGLSGRPLQLTQTNPLLVFAYSLIDVAFEPGFFGGHLTPHDAPARACARARTASETHDSWRVLLAIADDAGVTCRDWPARPRKPFPRLQVSQASQVKQMEGIS